MADEKIEENVESLPIFPTVIDHVVFIAFENHSYNQIIKSGPYFKMLATKYGRLTNYKEICNPSLPNYLAVTCGTPFNKCGTDSVSVFDTKNIFSLANDKKLTWAQYSEGQIAPCVAKGTKFAVRHCPAFFYKNIIKNSDPNYCPNHVLPLIAWNSLINAGKIPPNLTFIIPNLCNDAHDCGIPTADAWLKKLLDPLLLKTWAKKTCFIIWFDEGYGQPGYVVFVNDLCKGKTVTKLTNDYHVITTIEWLLNLGTCGHNDKPTEFPPLKSLFGK